MKYAYPACFYQEDDGRFSVVFADFELATFGADLADAIYMAADAAAGRILSMLNDGEKLPKPSNIKKIRPDDPSGFVSMVYIDEVKYIHAQQINANPKTDIYYS